MWMSPCRQQRLRRVFRRSTAPHPQRDCLCCPRSTSISFDRNTDNLATLALRYGVYDNAKSRTIYRTAEGDRPDLKVFDSVHLRLCDGFGYLENWDCGRPTSRLGACDLTNNSDAADLSA